MERLLVVMIVLILLTYPANADSDTGPGTFMDLFSHAIDYIRYFFATPESQFNLSAINSELSVHKPNVILEHRDFFSSSLNERKNYTILLPPNYYNSSGRYPVYYLLHGAWGNERTWATRGNISRIYQELLAEGAGEFIIAMPDGGNTVWENGCTFLVFSCGNKEDYFFEFIRHIDSSHRTNDRRAIGGLSFGARGAMRLAFLRPDMFRFVGSHSGYYTFLIREMNEDNWQGLARSNLTIYFDNSKNDVLTEYSQSSLDLDRNLTARGIPHEYRQVDFYTVRSHAWPFWKQQARIAIQKACDVIC